MERYEKKTHSLQTKPSVQRMTLNAIMMGMYRQRYTRIGINSTCDGEQRKSLNEKMDVTFKAIRAFLFNIYISSSGCWFTRSLALASKQCWMFKWYGFGVICIKYPCPAKVSRPTRFSIQMIVIWQATYNIANSRDHRCRKGTDPQLDKQRIFTL